jgi:hypothetical protein
MKFVHQMVDFQPRCLHKNWPSEWATSAQAFGPFHADFSLAIGLI